MVKLVNQCHPAKLPMEDAIQWPFVCQMAPLVWSNVIAGKASLGMESAQWGALLDLLLEHGLLAGHLLQLLRVLLNLLLHFSLPQPAGLQFSLAFLSVKNSGLKTKFI